MIARILCGLRYQPKGCTDLYQVDSLRQVIECAPVSPVLQLDRPWEEGHPFCGDKVSAGITWERARLEELNSRIVRLRFVLRSASLFTFRIG
jgi:hypothetical protein